MREMLAAFDRYNVRTIVASRPPQYLKKWIAATTPGRIIPSLGTGILTIGGVDAFRESFHKGEFAAIGEFETQYEGISPGDPIVEPYMAVAEEFDIPFGIHMGLGPPGVAYTYSALPYRARLSNPLLLEDALLRHPKLRVFVMHAGWPMLDEIIHLLHSHPQVYADLSFINWALPRKEFHFYMRRLVEAGFGKRLMYGSDQIRWPQAIGISIESIETADFLTEEQKRDIFYNNAVRFLRLEKSARK